MGHEEGPLILHLTTTEERLFFTRPSSNLRIRNRQFQLWQWSEHGKAEGLKTMIISKNL